jgi:NifU-like protein involved in Fe-S cluster formation
MTGEDPRYGPEVRRLMATLAGSGSWPAGERAIAVGRAGDREQGAEVVLYLRVTDGLVAEARFEAFGCPHLLAAASWLCDRLRGADRAGVDGWDWREAAKALAVPAAKFGRLLTLQDACRAAARNWPEPGRSTV